MGDRARPFTARYERRPDGWLVRAHAEGGAVTTFGRTLDRARANLVAELAPRLGTYAGNVVVDDEIELPEGVHAAVDAARDARNAALEAVARSQAAAAKAANALVDSGLSLRDTGYVLGLSHARVQQLVDRRQRSGKGKQR